MSDRPILFSGPMVAAMLEGRKTQTRRVIKKKAAHDALPVFGPDFLLLPGNVDLIGYAPGDRLWVREAWKCEERFHAVAPHNLKPGVPVYYSADPDPRDSNPGCAGRHRAGMHMPRWASRLTLIVSDVRVQRLQEITEDDSVAEGAPVADHQYTPGARMCETDKPWRRVTPTLWFHELWDSLNASRGFGWGMNPWVCALTFTVYPQNIDQMEAAQ